MTKLRCFQICLNVVHARTVAAGGPRADDGEFVCSWGARAAALVTIDGRHRKCRTAQHVGNESAAGGRMVMAGRFTAEQIEQEAQKLVDEFNASLAASDSN